MSTISRQKKQVEREIGFLKKLHDAENDPAKKLGYLIRLHTWKSVRKSLTELEVRRERMGFAYVEVQEVPEP